MHSGYWRVDNGQLLKWSLTSNDSCGNTYKEVRRGVADNLTYEFRTYWDGMASGQENLALARNAWFYDELPWRVRTIDFGKPSGTIDLLLCRTAITSKKDNFDFKPARLTYTTSPRTIDIVLQHEGGTDKFVLDRNGPYLLREWVAADGGRLRMKRCLKVDYWNYNKPGDREKALNNPMLRPPD
jgi:hypothetical protein